LWPTPPPLALRCGPLLHPLPFPGLASDLPVPRELDPTLKSLPAKIVFRRHTPSSSSSSSSSSASSSSAAAVAVASSFHAAGSQTATSFKFRGPSSPPRGNAGNAGNAGSRARPSTPPTPPAPPSASPPCWVSTPTPAATPRGSGLLCSPSAFESSSARRTTLALSLGMITGGVCLSCLATHTCTHCRAHPDAVPTGLQIPTW
jgi:hypothetical protein